MPSISPTMLSRWAAVSGIVSNLVSYIYIDDYLAPSASAQLGHIGELLRDSSQMLENSKSSLEMFERALPLADFAAFVAQHRALRLNVADETRMYRSLTRRPGMGAPDPSIATTDLEAFRKRVVELHTTISVYEGSVSSASRNTTKRKSPQLAPAFPDEEIGPTKPLSPANVQAPTNSAATWASFSRRRSEILLGAASGAPSASPSAPPDSDASWYRRIFDIPDRRTNIVGNRLDLDDNLLHAISDLRQRWTGRLEVNGSRVLDHGREYLSIEDAIENFEDFGIEDYSTS